MKEEFAKWISREDNRRLSRCSDCGNDSIVVTVELLGCKQIIEICPKCCPNCGKRMLVPGTSQMGTFGDVRIEGVI